MFLITIPMKLSERVLEIQTQTAPSLKLREQSAMMNIGDKIKTMNANSELVLLG